MEEQKKYSAVFETKSEEIEDREDEEEEVDKFISLIRTFRETRNIRINELNRLTSTTTTTTTSDNMSKRMKIRNCKQECSGWIPTFEIQDFINISEAQVNKCSIGKERIDVREGSKEENDGEGGSEVDLRLTL